MELMFRGRRPVMRMAGAAALGTLTLSGPLELDDDIVIEPTNRRLAPRGITVADLLPAE